MYDDTHTDAVHCWAAPGDRLVFLASSRDGKVIFLIQLTVMAIKQKLK